MVKSEGVGVLLSGSFSISTEAKRLFLLPFYKEQQATDSETGMDKMTKSFLFLPHKAIFIHLTFH